MHSPSTLAHPLQFHHLKRTVSQDFRPSVFLIKQSPLGPWFTEKSRLPYGFVSAEKIEIIVCKVRIPRSQWDRRIGFRVLNETAESNPAVSMRPQKPIPRSQWDCGNRWKKFYLRIFGCSLPEPHNFSCRIPRYQWDRGIGSRGLCSHEKTKKTIFFPPKYCTINIVDSSGIIKKYLNCSFFS
jgi:hypothetical protein